MKISIISFTRNGINLSTKIVDKLKNRDCLIFTKCSAYLEHQNKESIQFVENRLGEWTKEQMDKRNALVFIGACGIAVRAIAPYITDKLHDSPVLVMDEKGQYIIPILSGHIGGANELALLLAEKIGAKPIITTATDINQIFAVDMFAKKNGLFIENKEGIANVSSKLLAGKDITMAIETGHIKEGCVFPAYVKKMEYPPKEPVDIVVTSQNKMFDAQILLRPRMYIIGMGCKKGKEAEKMEQFIRQTMNKIGISIMQVAALASIDRKREEEGLNAWSRKWNIPFLTYCAEQLQNVTGTVHKSEFVKMKVGVDNVCERAALKAAGSKATLIYEKHAEDGMTIAIAKKEWSVDFHEK
ncbi:MAG: cobalt-precorrin 5A hydrolase [Clostridiales bacterium]|nr:cobalt-precorrin 5A hydrolase [Clostridiales bacterium]